MYTLICMLQYELRGFQVSCHIHRRLKRKHNYKPSGQFMQLIMSMTTSEISNAEICDILQFHE